MGTLVLSTKCFHSPTELGGRLYRDVSHVGHTRRVHDADHVAQPTEAFAAQRRFAGGHPDRGRARVVGVSRKHVRAAARRPRIRVSTQFFR